ncbi:MAG: ribosomal protein S18-alanine N-acetyltransferase [Deltaproteobacteria bacterium]|nr:ribosomal protein S18-alanine N-acetyltransferase [Deltaproteobacteria bacterium]
MELHHLPQVVDIEQRSFTCPWSLRQFALELARPYGDSIIMAGADERQVLGYALWWVVMDEVEILNVAVHPDFRGRGLGRLLLTELIARAGLNGGRAFFLEVRPSNPAALALYDSLGFKPVGVRPRYYDDTGEDALLMRLTIE